MNQQFFSKTKFLLDNDIDDYVNNIDKLPNLECFPNAAATPRGPQGKKGQYNGIKFDSLWEFGFYLYWTRVKGIPVERNTTEYVEYFDEKCKKRKFYPDFIVMGKFYEVKGFFRPTDECKRTQHPEVEFVYGDKIKELIAIVNKKCPNWREEYMMRS